MQIQMVMGFESFRRRKHEAGVREHRGGDHSAPFNGDPVLEIYEEQADTVSYAEEAARQRLITAHRANNIDALARQIIEELALGVEEMRAERQDENIA